MSNGGLRVGSPANSRRTPHGSQFDVSYLLLRCLDSFHILLQQFVFFAVKLYLPYLVAEVHFVHLLWLRVTLPIAGYQHNQGSFIYSPNLHFGDGLSSVHPDI